MNSTHGVVNADDIMSDTNVTTSFASTRLRNISIRVGDQLDVIKQEVADKNIVTTESLNKLIHTWEEANEALILCYEDIFQIHTLEARAMESFQRYLRRSWKRIDRFEKNIALHQQIIQFL